MKDKIIEWLSRPRTVAQQVMINNMKKALMKEEQRVKVAKQGLLQIIEMYASKVSEEWKPGADQMAVETIVAAENTLREMGK